MKISGIALLLLSVQIIFAQVTLRKNVLLSRRKRYLLFPKGANFVMTFILVKAFLIKAYRGTNTLLECDIPFPLPYETRLLQKYRKRLREKQRRDVLDQIETTLNHMGYNGNACIQQLICEANQYIQKTNNTFLGDLISTIFHDLTDVQTEFGPLEDHNFFYDCNSSCSLQEQCPFPIYELVTGAFSPVI